MIARSPRQVLFKRYARSRLYDTEATCYVTADELRRRTRDGVAVEVRDAINDEDVTRVLLAGPATE